MFAVFFQPNFWGLSYPSDGRKQMHNLLIGVVFNHRRLETEKFKKSFIPFCVNNYQ